MEQILSNLKIGELIVSYLDDQSTSRLRETNRIVRNIVDDIICSSLEIDVNISNISRFLRTLDAQYENHKSNRGRMFRTYDICLIVDNEPDGFDWLWIEWFIRRGLISITSTVFQIIPSRVTWIKCLGYTRKLQGLKIHAPLLKYPIPLQHLHHLTLSNDEKENIQMPKHLEHSIIDVFKNAVQLRELTVEGLILSPASVPYFPQTIMSLHLFSAAYLWSTLSNLPLTELSISRVSITEIYDLFLLLNTRSESLISLKIGKLPRNIYHHWPKKMNKLRTLSLEYYDGPICALNMTSFPSLTTLELTIDECPRVINTMDTLCVRKLILNLKNTSKLQQDALSRLSYLFPLLNEVSLTCIQKNDILKAVIQTFPKIASLTLYIEEISKRIDERLFAHIHNLARLETLIVNGKSKNHAERRLNFSLMLKNMKNLNCVKEVLLKEVKDINYKDLSRVIPNLKILRLIDCTLAKDTANTPGDNLYVKSSTAKIHDSHCLQCALDNL